VAITRAQQRDVLEGRSSTSPEELRRKIEMLQRQIEEPTEEELTSNGVVYRVLDATKPAGEIKQMLVGDADLQKLAA
jgi:hypothetical protein